MRKKTIFKNQSQKVVYKNNNNKAKIILVYYCLKIMNWLTLYCLMYLNNCVPCHFGFKNTKLCINILKKN